MFLIIDYFCYILVAYTVILDERKVEVGNKIEG